MSCAHARGLLNNTRHSSQASSGCFRAELPFYLFLWTVQSWRIIAALGSELHVPIVAALRPRFLLVEVLAWFLITPVLNLVKCVRLAKASSAHMAVLKLRRPPDQDRSVGWVMN